LWGIVFGSSRLVAIGGWLSLSAGVNLGAAVRQIVFLCGFIFKKNIE
jgi:hypothetical protein